MAKVEEPLERIHVQLYERDVALLRVKYGHTPGIGPTIRYIVRRFLKLTEPNAMPALAPEMQSEVDAILEDIHE